MTLDDRRVWPYVDFALQTLGLAVSIGFILVILTGVSQGLGYTIDRELYGLLLLFGSVSLALVVRSYERLAGNSPPGDGGSTDATAPGAGDDVAPDSEQSGENASESDAGADSGTDATADSAAEDDVAGSANEDSDES